jgi:hypothetical protein
MSADHMNYSQMVEDALRGVVREALKRAGAEGLVGNHHFYISFRTTHSGVDIADHLRAQHPQEMTIVLQHQYWGLEVDDEGFAVTLSFRGAHERLHIPFAAVTGFADPGVQFGLQFNVPGGAVSTVKSSSEASVVPPADKTAPEAPTAAEAQEPEPVEADEHEGAEVVTLDTFRGKK